jgi:hypothetical protein
MNSKNREKWAKTRARGKPRFILIYGVLYWGTATAFITAILQAFLGKDLSLYTFVSLQFLIKLTVFLVIGYVYGDIMWNINERRYLNR